MATRRDQSEAIHLETRIYFHLETRIYFHLETRIYFHLNKNKNFHLIIEIMFPYGIKNTYPSCNTILVSLSGNNKTIKAFDRNINRPLLLFSTGIKYGKIKMRSLVTGWSFAVLLWWVRPFPVGWEMKICGFVLDTSMHTHCLDYALE